ncbi:MAG: DUF1569 domain-containing protein [Phycisphaerales bacterium]
MTTGTVNTKKAPRRELRLGSLKEISADLDRIQGAHDAGTLTTTGNWSAGQILSHVAILMECAVDGFPDHKPPLFVRVICKTIIKPKALRGDLPPAGIQLPEKASYLIPPQGTTFEEGMARLRRIIGRIDSGERFTHDSPVFGKLTHEQWETLQGGHASLHLGFIDLGGGVDG